MKDSFLRVKPRDDKISSVWRAHGGYFYVSVICMTEGEFIRPF